MLKYEVHGAGEPLVLVHGLTHRRQAWYPLLEHLTDHREVVIFDLPGHGESPDLVVENGDLHATLRTKLLQMLDAIGLHKPHISGNSLGGRIALEAAADGIVRSASALSPAGFWHNAIDLSYTRVVFGWLANSNRLMAPVIPLLAHSGLSRAFMGAMVAAHPTRISPEVIVADAAAMRRALPAMNTIFPAADPFRRPVSKTIPVTVAWGARDLILPPYHALIARRHLPHARHIWLRSCGHVPMTDDPQLIAKVLLDGSKSGAPTDPGPIEKALTRTV